MKAPVYDWEDSSGDFRDAFEESDQYSNLSRDDVEDIVSADLARAQRMASAGLRHLRAILGANTISGIRDRWRRDALAVPFFGKTSGVHHMKAVRSRLERAHRRLRDDHLHIRMRQQRHASSDTVDGRNAGAFLSPKRFQLFPDFARSDPVERSATIVHELLHEWLIDQKIGNDIAYDLDEVLRLASRAPHKARNNPSNYDSFLAEVWSDEGLETPSGAILIDRKVLLTATAVPNATGLLRDRPVLCAPAPNKRQDIVFCALRAKNDEALIPSLFEVDATPMRRRAEQTGAIARASYPAACAMLTTSIAIVATRSPQTKRLELRAWEVEGETIAFLGDSGTQFGDCSAQPDVIALGPHHFCLTYKIKNGRMRVELCTFFRESGFHRITHAETSGPIHDHGRAVIVSPLSAATGESQLVAAREFTVATVFRSREGKLSFDIWHLDVHPAQVTRRGGLVDTPITGRPGVAMARRRGQWVVVAAARDKESGRLRLTSFDVSDPARPKRLGDSGDMGARMTHSPDIVTVQDGEHINVVTAVRYVTGGRSIVSLWRAGSDPKLFTREHDSDVSRTPVIKGSPSIVPLGGQQSPVLISSAVGPDDKISFARWQMADPVRANG